MARRLLELVALLAITGCHRRHEPTPESPPLPPHVVAATHASFKIDGELDEPDWNALGDPQAFTIDGQEARPYSAIRFLHDAEHLYIGLYAADQDIRSNEKFELTIGSLVLAVDPLAHVVPAIAGVRAAKDMDGTLDQPADEDEEWVIELAIPLAAIEHALGPDPIPAFASRCDTPKDGKPRCGTWRAALRLAR